MPERKISALNLIGVNPNKLGALEEYALGVSKELVRRGHSAFVGFLKFPPSGIMQEFRNSDIKVLGFDHKGGSISFIRKLRRIIQENEINILHVTFYNIYSPVFVLSILGHTTHLIYSDQYSRVYHPSMSLKSIYRFSRNRMIQRFIHTIVADAKFIKECHMQDEFVKSNKVQVIYNGVNIERFNRSSIQSRSKLLNEFKIPEKSRLIVTVAQCIPYKGLDYLLEAARIVLEKHSDTFFFIIGDGPDRKELERKAYDLKIRDRCFFTGVRMDTENFLGSADIFVLLSVWEEAFAFSLLEAMASGCPVVATNIGAIPESVQDGATGILVPPRDAGATATAISKLLDDESLRLKMGRAARKRVEDNFSLRNWVNQTIHLYESAVKQYPENPINPVHKNIEE